MFKWNTNHFIIGFYITEIQILRGNKSWNSRNAYPHELDRLLLLHSLVHYVSMDDLLSWQETIDMVELFYNFYNSFMKHKIKDQIYNGMLWKFFQSRVFKTEKSIKDIRHCGSGVFLKLRPK